MTPTTHPKASSRREAIVTAVALALLARPASAAAQRSDIAVLIKLVAREEAAAEAYGISQPLPRLYDDELDHAAALRTQLDALGRRPAPRGLDAPARRLAKATGDDRLEAAIALEETLVRDYSAALVDLADPGILQTAATILASHAQHLVRLSGHGGSGQLP
jgi:ferritin-like protein